MPEISMILSINHIACKTATDKQLLRFSTFSTIG
jgi:hypothetical protein